MRLTMPALAVLLALASVPAAACDDVRATCIRLSIS